MPQPQEPGRSTWPLAPRLASLHSKANVRECPRSAHPSPTPSDGWLPHPHHSPGPCNRRTGGKLKRRPSWAEKFEGSEAQSRVCAATFHAADEAFVRRSNLQRRPSWEAKFEGGEGSPGAVLLKATATQPQEIARGEHAARQTLQRRPSWAAKWEGTVEHQRAAASAAAAATSAVKWVVEADEETVEAVTHPCMHGL